MYAFFIFFLFLYLHNVEDFVIFYMYVGYLIKYFFEHYIIKLCRKKKGGCDNVTTTQHVNYTKQMWKTLRSSTLERKQWIIKTSNCSFFCIHSCKSKISSNTLPESIDLHNLYNRKIMWHGGSNCLKHLSNGWIMVFLWQQLTQCLKISCYNP